MKLKVINKDFSICQIKDLSEVDFSDEFCFIGKTDEEISLVCDTNNLPSNILSRDDNWKAFRIEGVLDFSLIGILSKISSLLAENNIGILVISTYNTDYILIKKENFSKAIKLLKDNDYQIIL